MITFQLLVIGLDCFVLEECLLGMLLDEGLLGLLLDDVTALVELLFVKLHTIFEVLELLDFVLFLESSVLDFVAKLV